MQDHIKEINSYLLHRGFEPLEYSVLDYAWGWRPEEPVIALIETASFQSAMNLYWSSAEYITKPWCLLINGDKVPSHQQILLEKLSRQYNIHSVNPEEYLPSVKQQLTRLVKILDTYIPDGSRNPLMDLGDSVKTWREMKPVNEYKYSVEIETGNLDAYKVDGELVPSRKTIPLTIRSNRAIIEGVLPRLVDTIPYPLFDTEHRNLPMVLRLRLGDRSQLSLRFEADKSNLLEATSFWRLHGEFIDTGKIEILENNTGKILFSCEA
ncbi:hypothetical protein GF326_13480 [Candidatus Bathyarchaeota archaeon]|nr:hypothetical protein [Candidatus Bathyarchaeota archaeon]